MMEGIAVTAPYGRRIGMRAAGIAARLISAFRKPAGAGSAGRAAGSPDLRGAGACAPRGGCVYKMALLPADGGPAEDRLVEVLSVDGIEDAGAGDVLEFTGRDAESGEIGKGSMLLLPDGTACRAAYGRMAVKGMELESDPHEESPYGSVPPDRPLEFGPDSLPALFPMAGGRRYDLAAVFPDGFRCVLRGVACVAPEEDRGGYFDGEGYWLDFKADLSPRDAEMLREPGGRLDGRMRMARLDGTGSAMYLERRCGERLGVVRITPVGGDAARDSARSLNRHLRSFARLRGIFLALARNGRPLDPREGLRASDWTDFAGDGGPAVLRDGLLVSDEADRLLALRR